MGCSRGRRTSPEYKAGSYYGMSADQMLKKGLERQIKQWQNKMHKIEKNVRPAHSAQIT